MMHPWLQNNLARTRRESNEGKLSAEMIRSLREFPSLSTIQRTALEAIAFSLPAKDIANLRAAFTRMDTVRLFCGNVDAEAGSLCLPCCGPVCVPQDGTGMIRPAEMREALKAEGMSEEEAAKIFDSVNQDKTSYVSYTEFLAATMSKRIYLTHARLNDAFDALDVDGSGFITRQNLREILGDDFTDERVNAMLEVRSPPCTWVQAWQPQY